MGDTPAVDISDEPIRTTKINAEYWFESARKEPDRGRAVMHCAQAMYAYKNAAYAFMRELASLRAEKERAEAAYADLMADREKSHQRWHEENAARMRAEAERDVHANHCRALLDDGKRVEAERDAALKDAERYRFIRAGKSGTYNTILIHAGSQLDAAIDAARKGEQ